MIHGPHLYISREWEYPAIGAARVADCVREKGTGQFKGYASQHGGDYVSLEIVDVTDAFRVVTL